MPSDAASLATIARRACVARSAIACAVIACLSGNPAQADSIAAAVEGGLRYESNLFRLPDGVDPAGRGRRSALIATLDAGLHVEQSYSLQRFTIDGAVRRYHYDPYDGLDFTGHDIAAAFDWSLTSALSGKLSYVSKEYPVDFADSGYVPTANPAKIVTRRADVDWQAGAALHPRLSAFQSEDKTDRLTFQRESSRSTSVEASLIYAFPSANTLEGYLRRARGTYLDTPDSDALQIDHRFHERETGLRTRWQFTGTSKLDGEVGYLDRTHDRFAVRDFSGAVGRVHYTWTPTGKVEVQVTASRALSSAQTSFSSYLREDSLSINPAWFATGLITVRPAFVFSRRNFTGSPLPGETLEERSRASSLQVDYALRRWIDVTFQIAHTSRNASNAIYQYVDRSAFISARVKFD